MTSFHVIYLTVLTLPLKIIIELKIVLKLVSLVK